MPGQRFGNYLLLKKIAAGGMAELYKAVKNGEQGFQKQLAIKKILPHLASDQDFIGMFVDEAKLAALLDHQNIVQIYDLGRIEDSYCIVMEYVRGKDLKAGIARGGKLGLPLRVEHACLITASVLSGLSYA
ncbi:MAG: protein kinase, partial [Nitrospirota bacterium]